MDQTQPTMRVGDIVVGHNPRRRLRRNAEESFGQSIKAKGVMTPVLLRVMSDGSRCLIAGGRRVRHAKAQLGDGKVVPEVVGPGSGLVAELTCVTGPIVMLVPLSSSPVALASDSANQARSGEEGQRAERTTLA